MISLRLKGDFNKLEKYLKEDKRSKVLRILERYGRDGVAALSIATPVNTGLTASSWYYEIVSNNNSGYSISFCNSNIQNGVPIAIILQYGHGTRNGGWVEGQDYINPSIKPVMDKLADAAWREVSRI